MYYRIHGSTDDQAEAVSEEDDVPKQSAPRYPELGLDKVFEKVRTDKFLLSYFPDERNDKRLTFRSFFWGILFAVRPAFAEALI